MKKIQLSICFLILAFSALSQTPSFAWAKGLGSSGIERGYDLKVDGSGNSYIVGQFSGTADFDPGAGVFNMTSNGSSDIYILKLDVNGIFVWANKIGSAGADLATSIDIDPTGNLLVSGYYSGPTDFDPGASVFNLTSLGVTDVFVLKLDQNGNFVWARSIGGTSGDQGYGIKADLSGNVIVSGIFNGTVDFDPGAGVFNLTPVGSFDGFVLKLNSSGNFIWAFNIGGSLNDNTESIETDASGNIYIAGDFMNTADFDPGAGIFNMTSQALYDGFILKVNSSGAFIWAKQLLGSSNGGANDLCLDNANNVVLGGVFTGTIDLDPGAGTFTASSSGAGVAFVLKLNSAGNFIWANVFGNGIDDSSVEGITCDPLNNIYYCGRFGGTVDFNSGAGVFNQTASGSSDLYICKIDLNANFIWAIQAQGGAGDDYGLALEFNSSRLYSTGAYELSPDFDPGVGTNSLSSNGSEDTFILKLNDCLVLSPSAAVNSIVCLGSALNFTASITGTVVPTYSWSGPNTFTSNLQNPTIASAGTMNIGVYTLTINNGGCIETTTTQVNTVSPLPTITVNSGTICSGNSFTIVPSGANTYTLQGGNAIVSPTTNTSYTVVGTSSLGCLSSNTATSTVSVNPLPLIGASTSNTLICVGQSATLTASGASTYTFNPGGAGTSIVVSPTITSTYTISGTSAQGCNNSSVLTQSVSTCAGLLSVTSMKENLVIYPNPSNGKLIIETNGLKKEFTVFNVIGSEILKGKIEEERFEINLENESSGIYFLRIGSQTTKIIKQ